MTEKIKSAIEALKLTRDTRFFIPKNEVLEISILSLKAWEDVLTELENMRDIIWQDTDDEQRIVRANAWDKIEILNKTIDIIKQRLKQIKE